MPTYKSKTALGLTPVVTLDDADIDGIPYEYVTAGNLAAGDIIVLGPIEADVKPFDCFLISDDLDTNGAPTITLSLGILNAAQTDIDAAATSTWISASNIGQTGGVARATSANCYLSGASSTTRWLGVKVVAGPATSAGAGKAIAAVVKASA